MSGCPLQVVECEFAHAGCSEKITQKDLPKHVELSVQKHLVLVSSYSVKELSDVRDELAETKKTLAETATKLAEKDKLVEVLQTRVRTLEMVTGLLPMEFTVANYSKHEGKSIRVDGPIICTMPKIQIKFFFQPPRWNLHLEVEL